MIYKIIRIKSLLKIRNKTKYSRQLNADYRFCCKEFSSDEFLILFLLTLVVYIYSNKYMKERVIKFKAITTSDNVGAPLK